MNILYIPYIMHGMIYIYKVYFHATRHKITFGIQTICALLFKQHNSIYRVGYTYSPCRLRQ